MKTLILVLLIMATTNVFSQGRYINKKEYEKLMKSFEGETKASRDKVISAFWEWINNEKYFTTEGMLESDPDIYDIDGKLNVSLFYVGALQHYNVSIIEKFDDSKQGAYFIKDTTIINEYMGKTYETQASNSTITVMGREVKTSSQIVGVEKICKKRFDLSFEAFENNKKRTTFKIVVTCYHDVFEIGKTTPEMKKYSELNEPKAFSFDIIKEIQDYIYKKAGK